ncbi:MAG: Holliday junction DNA helicase RuvA [Candidatus Magasanikbacteria bacterium RIFCSPLOWO2_01_FULL_43_20b]|uniref:Holliday junction branch migration complex subunit RuvA n=1 Tax=Candidatus Magasanikbacteria bacterium RIFCSPLOWO2_12_FULL_43_12 TaxID=1798692 RepID=A0A1F6MTQ1_9BACT|nr:MAG: Holliday junction DNA helicase RuvA [Candidatus Magasanikbacteria bacterium RIFCSPHIGHO2_02_FULL_44_13]OGH72705.1 MAG: Holliday junction DNA helicase RuvA [Candidatus Magasanikbacteria bacterium RIFCSPLOWO2_02_FULL_43_22]OGH72871.1 MAG: Holliday junction DNA helicase RuvA [Candidatus Magasanikbacteria bacterium RIFCSPLOWO2_01_FULL_43_20b]OGH75001.1 MAG: Holliday junction DNA helicase RuvA [Candidatus Magasanikbacteria bacterium RIFCSPLOWO2_12_FULL_43_12]
MISYLKGKIIEKSERSVLVLTSGGVGYKVCVKVRKPAMSDPSRDGPREAEGCSSLQVGDSISLYTYLRVGENALDLFGFETLEEKSFFELLLTVSGIGPKSAMHILELGSLEEISAAIGRGDVGYLTKVSGIGKKTAERVVVELKSKVTKSVKSIKFGDGDSEVLGEVIDGLVSLGYSREEAREAVKGLSVDGKDAGKLVKEALRRLGK